MGRRRCRFALAFVALAIHLLVPVAAYAALPASAGGDFCRSGDRAPGRVARNASPTPSIPIPGQTRHFHAHCASCFGASLAATLAPGPAIALLVRPSLIALNRSGAERPANASSLALLPPLRGPPQIRA